MSNNSNEESAKEKKNRDSITEVIRKIGAKQTRMETKGEWNVVSQEDAMIMALTSMIENKTIGGSKSNNREKGNPSNLSKEERAKLRDSKISDWKKKAPADGEPQSQVVDKRTYYWYMKYREGKGMWTMHEKHDDNFQSGKNTNSGVLKHSTAKDTTSNDKRKVTFNTV